LFAAPARLQEAPGEDTAGCGLAHTVFAEQGGIGLPGWVIQPGL
jgi:hypothetical protein